MQRSKHLLIIGNDHRTHEIGMGVRDYCRVHGKWEFRWEREDHIDMVPRVLEAIHKWNVDGIIVHIRSETLLRLIRRAGRPVINLSGWRRLEFPAVICDDLAIGQMAARHLLDNGLRHFAFCAITVEEYSQSRCDGFARELAGAGYGCNVCTDEFSGQMEADWTRNSRRTDRWLLSLDKPVGILCAYDLRAHYVAVACQRLGLRVPDDVAIIGVGNEEFICEMCAPPLSSIATNLHKFGYQAMRLLHRILRGERPPSRPMRIAPRGVVARGSSDVIAIADPDVSAALRYIRQHAHESLSVKEILNHVAISRKMLEIKFAKLLGRTPGQEIARVRIELIKNMLADTKWPLFTVAQKTGFSKASKFSEYFRREIDMTPTQYRQAHQIDGTASAHK